MRKRLVIIFSLLSMMVIILHDIIPHHHHDNTKTEIPSGHMPEHQNSIKETDRQRDHFPHHHHFCSNEDPFVQRNPISLNKTIKDFQKEFGRCSHPFTDFYCNLALIGPVTLSEEIFNPLPAFLPFNLTRGSPAVS